MFAQPSYQSAAVAHYLSTNTHLPADHYYNKSGRAYPDVAAVGVDFVIVQFGSEEGYL